MRSDHNVPVFLWWIRSINSMTEYMLLPYVYSGLNSIEIFGCDFDDPIIREFVGLRDALYGRQGYLVASAASRDVYVNDMFEIARLPIKRMSVHARISTHRGDLTITPRDLIFEKSTGRIRQTYRLDISKKFA